MSGSKSVIDAWNECDKVDTLFVFVCLIACWIVVPAVGLGYSGYSTRKNGLASFLPSLFCILIVSIHWWAIGYSLAFSEGGGAFIGDLKNLFHAGVSSSPIGTIPALLFSEFQMVFCATVCAISVGGICERGRLVSLVPFILLWSTFVYCPLARMVWADQGFLANLGVLDFAGGTPVHICSGATATALSVYLSRPLFRSKKSSKRTPSHLRLHKPHNTMNQLVALILIWSCWLPFEAGTALAFNFRSIMTLCVTNLCAASGAFTWTMMTYFESGKWSLDSTFLGMLAGLVMITPAGGFVGMGSAVVLGAIGSVFSRQVLRFKFTERAQRLRWVDCGDTFTTHCVGGVLATICTGIFASKEITAYDGTEIVGGALFDGNWAQIPVQLLEAVVGFTWTFSASYFFIALIDCVPGLEVLCMDSELKKGMDAAQMEESFSDEHWISEVDYEPLSTSLRLD
ncbi:putative ammonium transporter [Violaceomyces palustris]|uniref:Ammonium transporter n=1 Tax=Violaceomyces palustris TaxID=1673888 RepID=A0ACD0P1U7_9BASI|nr:putative ammonium transporter [Violaceomyces palustris]